MMTMLVASPALAQREQALMVAMPEGFRLAFKHDAPDGSMKMTEFVPTGQTVDNWQQMITVQHFPKLAGADPRELAARWSAAPGRGVPARADLPASAGTRDWLSGGARLRAHHQNAAGGRRRASSRS